MASTPPHLHHVSRKACLHAKLCVGLMPESMLSIWDPNVLLLARKMIACKASTCPNTASDVEYTMVRHIG